MVLDLLSLVGAYAAGTCRDKVSTLYLEGLVAAIFLYIVPLKLRDWWFPPEDGESLRTAPQGLNSVSDSNLRHEALKMVKAGERRLRMVLMLLATFAVSVTYGAGLSRPGGFWDSTGARHRPGDAILKDRHSLRLTLFLLCNTTSFLASLLITMLLIIDRKLRSLVLYACIVALVGLVGAYAAGGCREIDTTVYVVSLAGADLAFILLHAMSYTSCSGTEQQTDGNQQTDDNASGVWQDNSNGHMAGNPILLTTNARRYNVFFYCNSVAFVASLVTIILVQKEHLVKHHALEAAMILDLFGLIGAYAAGTCRDVNHSIYALGLPGAVLVYVVIHIVFFTLDHKEKKDDNEDRLLEKRRKRLLLFAILSARPRPLPANAAGSSRVWKTSMYVVALIFAVVGYFAFNMALSFLSSRRHPERQSSRRRQERQSSQGNHPE